MKKRLLAVLLLTFMLATVGCGAKEEATTPANETNTTSEDEQAANKENNTATDASAISGTWQSSSITGEGDYPCEYYVQFGASEIQYGHITSTGKFEAEYSDRINSFEEIGTNSFMVKATASNGTLYTYRTSIEDTSKLEYFGTWNEAEFDNNYSASDSLSMMQY